MGNNLFGANISAKAARALGQHLLPGTITRTVPGSRTSGSLSAGTNPVETAHTFRGIRIGISALYKGTIHPEAKDAVLMLGDTINPTIIPEENDKVAIEGLAFTIVGISRDPDAATYTCQVK